MTIESEKIKTPLRTVHTKLNTSLEDWTAMLIHEIKRLKIDAGKVTKLAVRHAWEYENTPIGFALDIQHTANRELRKLENKPKV